VIGFSEPLAEETNRPLNDDQKRFVAHILKDSRHLLALINGILDLSKIEAGKLELIREDLDLGALLADALSSIRPQGIEKSIEIETRVAGPMLVDADRLRMTQILYNYNLLSNAVKFTPKGGRIRVDAGTADGMARIAVGDTGIGIPPEEACGKARASACPSPGGSSKNMGAVSGSKASPAREAVSPSPFR
jgi:signal transduction histidine kinase